MIRALPGFFILLSAIFLCSCSKKLYTHKQVMQSFHTKNDVLKKFGNPDIKRMADSTEIWIYNRDIGAKSVDSTAKISKINIDTTKALPIVKQGKYINFMFDYAGNVVGYKSNGIDLSYEKKISAGTNILKALGTAAVIAIIVGLEFYNNSGASL
jgi:hypothetical protein